jgi:hypothetical protein
MSNSDIHLGYIKIINLINKMKKSILLSMLAISSIFLQIGCAPQSIMNVNSAKWQVFPPNAPSPQTKQIQAAISGYNRLITSTYLTYPEWYIVYNSQEYADYLKSHLPSSFPYFSSISQYWWGYGAVNHITKNRFPPDMGDHLMLSVIGTSYSLEYVIKGFYENSIGKFTELLSGNEPTEEDRYGQKVAEEYANYIPKDPWFDFSYIRALSGLWTKTSLVGPHMIRKAERKLIFSLEYSIKAVYASIIRAGSHLTYGTVDTSVYALANNVPRNIYKKHKNIKPVKSINAKADIISLPSEQPFTEAITKMMNSGVQFKDIAGNSEILVTAVTPRNWVFKNKNAQLLFTVNILTQPKLHRIAIRVPTKSLLTILEYLQRNNAVIEHVYAY